MPPVPVIGRMAALGVLTLLTACGAESPSSGAPGQTAGSSTTASSSTISQGGNLPNACTLLTAAEVQSFVSGTVGPPQGSASDCKFAQQGSGKAVDVTVMGPASRDQFTSEMQQFSGKSVSGVGDAAFLAQANSFVAFLKGSTEVKVQYSTSLIGADDVTGLETLAMDAAGRV